MKGNIEAVHHHAIESEAALLHMLVERSTQLEKRMDRSEEQNSAEHDKIFDSIEDVKKDLGSFKLDVDKQFNKIYWVVICGLAGTLLQILLLYLEHKK